MKPVGRGPSPGAGSLDAITCDLLLWLAAAPRSFAATMDAWRTSCPRLSIWEDALAAGLIRIAPAAGEPAAGAMVVLTPRGYAALDGRDCGMSPRTRPVEVRD